MVHILKNNAVGLFVDLSLPRKIPKIRLETRVPVDKGTCGFNGS